MTGEPSITCPHCGMTSYNLNDVVNVYCGNCHCWLPTETVPDRVRIAALGQLYEIRRAHETVDLFAPGSPDDGH